MAKIRQEDIREKWETVKPALEEIKRRFNAPWRPEDIYAECVYGEARLYSSEEDPDKFAVVKINVDKYTKERSLFVWVAWGGKDRHVQEKYMEDFAELAIANNASRIEMRSPRRGFARMGWKISSMVTYFKEIANER